MWKGMKCHSHRASSESTHRIHTLHSHPVFTSLIHTGRRSLLFTAECPALCPATFSSDDELRRATDP